MPVTVAAMREEQEKGTWDRIETTIYWLVVELPQWWLMVVNGG